MKSEINFFKKNKVLAIDEFFEEYYMIEKSDITLVKIHLELQAIF